MSLVKTKYPRSTVDKCSSQSYVTVMELLFEESPTPRLVTNNSRLIALLDLCLYIRMCFCFKLSQLVNKLLLTCKARTNQCDIL